MGQLPYKLPTIVRGKKYWHVAYFYEYPDIPGKYKKFQVKDGVNYVRDLDQREVEIQTLRKDIEIALKRGFNPFMSEQRIESQFFAEETILNLEEDRARVKPWTMIEGMKEFKKNCNQRNLSDNTIRTYNSFINNIEEWLIASENTEIKASEFSSDHALEFLNIYLAGEKLGSRSQEKLTSRTYNNHCVFFGTLFNRISKLEKKRIKDIRYSIDLDDLELKKDRAEKNRYYAPAIATKIKTELANHPDLYNYIKWIFYSCMRPREISLLQVQHIDLESRQIKAIAPTAKTGDRYVPICDELHDLIRKMKLTELPSGYYVFGKDGKPSPEKIYKDHFSGLYRSVKKKFKLDDKYTLYGWKHTRVVNLLAAGFTDPEVMSLTGHRDYQSFMAYRRELMVDTTTMKGKTMDF